MPACKRHQQTELNVDTSISESCAWFGSPVLRAFRKNCRPDNLARHTPSVVAAEEENPLPPMQRIRLRFKAPAFPGRDPSKT